MSNTSRGVVGVLLALAATVVFSACQRQTQERTLTAADVLAISKQHQEAWLKMDADAIVACYTVDAVVADIDVPPFYFENPEGVRQWVTNSFKNFTKVTGLTQDMRLTRIMGNLAISQSHYAFTMVTPDGKDFVSHGWATEVVKMTESGPKLAAFHAGGMTEAMMKELEKIAKK